MVLFEIMSKYFWVLAIAMTGVNFLILKKRSKKYIQENPELSEGYKKLFRGYAFWMNMPWVVMGIGCTIGNVPSISHYFRPKDGNPYVLAWYMSVIILWILGTNWLFLKNGAQIIAKHPGLFVMYSGSKRKEMTNPKLIKIFWLLCLAGGILAFVFMWILDVPIPNFR